MSKASFTQDKQAILAKVAPRGKGSPQKARAGQTGFKTPAWLDVLLDKISGNPEKATQRSVYSFFVVMISCMTVGAFVFSTYRSDVLFAVNQQGQPTLLQSMPQPNTSSEAVISWTRFAVSEVMTLNFGNMYDRLASAERYFTPQGWQRYIAAFRDDGAMTAIIDGRQFITTIPGGTAVISEEGEVSGQYTWVVQLNTISTVYTGNKAVQRQNLSVHVTRIPTAASPAGYAFGIDNVTR